MRAIRHLTNAIALVSKTWWLNQLKLVYMLGLVAGSLLFEWGSIASCTLLVGAFIWYLLGIPASRSKNASLKEEGMAAAYAKLADEEGIGQP